MPAFKRFDRRLMLPGRRRYSLFDSFSVDAAAGAVNGTYSDKSHSLRTVVDTNGTISVAGGLLDFATGAAANDGGRYPIEARVAGRVLHGRITLSDTRCVASVGWDANTSGGLSDAFKFSATGVLNVQASGASLIVGEYEATTYDLWLVMRATGMYAFIKGGAFTYPTLLRQISLATAAYYPAVTQGSITYTFSADDIRIARRLWLPEPIAYDAFTRANGALGVSDIVGPDGQACVSRTWSFPAGTWAISTNKAVGTPTATEQVVNPGAEGTYVAGTAPNWGKAGAGDGTLSEENTIKHGGAASQKFVGGGTNDIGTGPSVVAVTAGLWYLFSGWLNVTAGTANVRRQAVAGLATLSLGNFTNTGGFVNALGTARAATTTTDSVPARQVGTETAATFYCDDWSLKSLSLASLFSSLSDAKTADVMVDVKVAALTTYTQAGVAIRLDSASAPTKGIVAYFNGAGSIVCDEFTAAATWSNLIAAVAKAFTAGDTLRISAIGTAIRLYHITAAGVATLIGTATATANVNTLHGMFNTSPGTNTFTSCQVFPTGSGNEFSALDRL